MSAIRSGLGCGGDLVAWLLGFAVAGGVHDRAAVWQRDIWRCFVDKHTPSNVRGEVREATRRLNRLVSNLLNMRRLESGHIKPNLDWCDIEDLIQVTLKEMERDLGHHKVTVGIAKGISLVRLDFVLTQLSLTNLLLNAVVHTLPGTSVQVRTSAQIGILTISVLDNGPGLPHVAIPFIFDKFYRAHSAPPGGTGLGLAIVKGFVEAQGGRVEASNLPEGAAFRIRLPISESPAVPGEGIA